MKTNLITICIMILASGCTQYQWHDERPYQLPDGSVVVLVDEGKWNSLWKDFGFGDIYSRSQSLTAKVAIKPVPAVEIEMKGE